MKTETASSIAIRVSKASRRVAGWRILEVIDIIFHSMFSERQRAQAESVGNFVLENNFCGTQPLGAGFTIYERWAGGHATRSLVQRCVADGGFFLRISSVCFGRGHREHPLHLSGGA